MGNHGYRTGDEDSAEVCWCHGGDGPGMFCRELKNKVGLGHLDYAIKTISFQG